MMLEDYIRQHAIDQPDKVAVVCEGRETTYRELWEAVDQRSWQLVDNGVGAGRVVVARTAQTTDFLIDYFAVHLAGATAMPLEKNMPSGRFDDIRQRYESMMMPDGIADILFTTGTTGKSKGVMVSHNTIIADAENLIDGQGFTPETTFIICGPLNHIGSLSKVYPVMMQGGTLIILEGMKDMEAFFNALDYPSTKMATFMVPATIRILLSLAKKRLAGYAGKIDFIEAGAAPLMLSDMQALCETLPTTRLYNTYASTETGIITTYNYNDGRCMAGCLGRPMRHSEVFITDEGLIACKGKTLMTGYAGEPEMTAQILRDNTIFTSDRGYIDDEGMLHIEGRNDDIINVGGFKVAPNEVENVAMSLPDIKDCICIAVDHPITGKALKLLVALNDGYTLDKRKIARHINATLESYKVPMLYEQADSIHRTFNGKLNRKAYS